MKIGPRDLNLMLLLFYEFSDIRHWQGHAFLMVVNGGTFLACTVKVMPFCQQRTRL